MLIHTTEFRTFSPGPDANKNNPIGECQAAKAQVNCFHLTLSCSLMVLIILELSNLLVGRQLSGINPSTELNVMSH